MKLFWGCFVSKLQQKRMQFLAKKIGKSTVIPKINLLPIGIHDLHVQKKLANVGNIYHAWMLRVMGELM